MYRNRIIHFIVPCLGLLLITCRQAFAQNVVFTANVSAGKVGVNDQFQVTYTIQDAPNVQAINNPSFKDFKVLGGPFTSRSSNVVISGNKMTESRSFSVSFLLQPKHPGVITIPPATASDGSGHSYQSNAVRVDVVPGSLQQYAPRGPATASSVFDDDPFATKSQKQAARQQQAAQPKVDLGNAIFIKVDVDKRAVRLGEQVTAIYKLYARVPMNVAISKLPSLNGFWTQDFDIPKQQKPVEEVVNGQKYQTFILKKSALFPQQSGKLTLDVAEAEGTAHIPVQVQHRSLFDDPIFQQAFGGTLMMSDPFFRDPFAETGFEQIPVHLKSSPVQITVSELPDKDKPADFTGAVGSYTVSGKLDKDQLTTDDVATLKLTISGSGNLKLFTAPALNLPTGLDSYEPNVLDTIMGRTTKISGEKIVTYSIAPRAPGNYDIPPLTLSWFDPESGTYKSAATPAYHLHVKPGKGGIATAMGHVGGHGEIDDQLILSSPQPIILSPTYWSLYALPLLLLLGVTVYKKREEETIADTVQNRNRQASKVAQKRLAVAGTMLQNNNARGFYDELSKSIWLYLSDKLNIPISRLGKTSALEAMRDQHVPGPVCEQVEKVLSECEMALYASSGSSTQMQQTFSEAAGIITSLERTLRAS